MHSELIVEKLCILFERSKLWQRNVHEKKPQTWMTVSWQMVR